MNKEDPEVIRNAMEKVQEVGTYSEDGGGQGGITALATLRLRPDGVFLNGASEDRKGGTN